MAVRRSSFFALEPPFFVVDQTGRPLMPLSEKQGRIRLGRTGGHHVVEHHAFSILKLERPVLAAELHLRHLVVAIRFEPRTADLLVVAATRTGVAVVVRIVVDMEWLPSSDTSKEFFSSDGIRVPSAESYAANVAAVVRELQTWLPLSNAALPFSELLTDDYITPGNRGWRQNVILHLISHIANLGLEFYIRPMTHRPELPDSAILRQTFIHMASSASSSPTFAARISSWPYAPMIEKQSLLLPSKLTGSDAMELTKLPHRGEQLGEAMLPDGRRVRGIIDQRLFERKLVLFVPILLSFLRIAWRGIDILEVNEIPANEHIRFIRIDT